MIYGDFYNEAKVKFFHSDAKATEEERDGCFGFTTRTDKREKSGKVVEGDSIFQIFTTLTDFVSQGPLSHEKI